MNVIIPNIDEDIPLPASALDAMPELSPQEELAMRARTIKLIADLNGAALEPTEENIATAQELAKQMMQNPTHRPEFAKYPNEVMAYLAGMVAYVVNKLVAEVENAKDSKARISALTKLGEVDGVDAFKKRSEITVKIQSIEEVERELFETLNMLEDQVVDVHMREVSDGLGGA